jgi:serine protease AprX
MANASVPAWIIDFLLLGKSQTGSVQRFMQDGGVVADVWLAFASDLTKPVRVLMTPAEGTTTADMAWELHQCLKAYRDGGQFNPFEKIGKREAAAVAPLENFVAATIYVDELLRVVMPLTRWWSEKKLGRMRHKAADTYPLVQRLTHEIRLKIGPEQTRTSTSAPPPESADRKDQDYIDRDYRVTAAAPIAALLGVICMAMHSQKKVPEPPAADQTASAHYSAWILNNAEAIAHAAQREFQHPLPNRLTEVKAKQNDPDPPEFNSKERISPALIQRVFLDRPADISNFEDALACTKADAASRVFEVSCKSITWAIIDSGIDSMHPAFLDWAEVTKQGLVDQADSVDVRRKYSRVRATYDFTLIEQIRNLDLSDPEPGSAAQKKAIKAVIGQLEKLPDKVSSPEWKVQAQKCLQEIAAQMRNRLIPDWRLIEPLIKIGVNDGAGLPSDHGTHVAGTMASDWRIDDKIMLKGVCPDIKLYDLRVIPATGNIGNPLRSTEFAVLAATEFVQFVNREAGSNGPVIHGVNISMSIPHDVRNYGCGATPVCVACDRLVGDGVVVVAAAGNRGWNEQEIGFGNFSFCSITDPGNALDVITVGSTHRAAPHTYGVSFFSSRGPTGDGRIKPDLVAPGEKIRGPVRGDTYQDMDGTSMAAPFVSGAAAMLLARNRELIRNPRRVKAILCESATDLGRERYFQGHGMLDILRALQRN